MARIAKIRTNVGVPFPALVTASGPVTIAKNSGVWTVGFSIGNLNQQSAVLGALSTDFLIVYDSVTKAFFKATLTDIQTMRTTTVAALPAAAQNKGVSFLVSDATATAFWSIVVGGGANVIPVTSDGVNWRIG